MDFPLVKIVGEPGGKIDFALNTLVQVFGHDVLYDAISAAVNLLWALTTLNAKVLGM